MKYRISSLGSIIALVFIAVAGIIGISLTSGINSDSTPIITGLLAIVGTTVPSILSLFKAESIQHDIRNGVLRNKVVEGTKQALVEHNVVTRDGPTVNATLEALHTVVSSNNLLLNTLKNRKEENTDGGQGV